MKTTECKVKLGADLLRDCVIWLNNRDEILNQGKTPQQLISEFCIRTRVDPNWYNL